MKTTIAAITTALALTSIVSGSTPPLPEDDRPQYQTVAVTFAPMLDRLVNEEMALGWEPFGGVAMCVSPDGTVFFAQAMTRRTR